MSLKREDAMAHAPDLLLLSQYDPELGEVAAFEELIGSHGGLGGPQTEPFILHPVEWTLDEEVPLGAPAIYRNIRRWLDVDRDRARQAGGRAAGRGAGGLRSRRRRSLLARRRRPIDRGYGVRTTFRRSVPGSRSRANQRPRPRGERPR